MASHRVGEAGLSVSGPSKHHNPYAVFHGSHPPTSFINQEGSAFDFGELDEVIAVQGVETNNDEAKAPLFSTGRSAATLEMFPSWPMRFHHTPRGSSQSGDISPSTDSYSSKAESHPDPEYTMRKKDSLDYQAVDQRHLPQQQQQLEITNNGNRTGLSQRKGVRPTSEKRLDAKTLRRLAQNREAARKSRLRKKAYVQQLETSRMKLTQLEQDLQQARAQGLLGGAAGPGGNISSGAAVFDMEYARWLEDNLRQMSELRAGLQAHLPDNDLRKLVDVYVGHYDELFYLKGVAVKSDVFHLITGMWTSPAERCFLWMGGFRPSELIKMLITQLHPLTEQQVMGIYSLQHSSQQAEEALSQGLDQLQQSLIDTVAGGSFNHQGMHHMALCLGKLNNLEGFVRQADNLRQQTLHQLLRILTVVQAARCFLAIGEYYARLRALSSLWTSRPREILMSDDKSCQTTADLQMLQFSQHHFSNF